MKNSMISSFRKISGTITTSGHHTPIMSYFFGKYTFLFKKKFSYKSSNDRNNLCLYRYFIYSAKRGDHFS